MFPYFINFYYLCFEVIGNRSNQKQQQYKHFAYIAAAMAIILFFVLCRRLFLLLTYGRTHKIAHLSANVFTVFG